MADVEQEVPLPLHKATGEPLPHIARLELPHTTTQTALVRWLWELGYQVRDISRGTGIRYQQVRNMVTTVPKRASREDLPPLKLVLRGPVDDVDAIMDEALDRSIRAGRSKNKAAPATRAPTNPEDEPGNQDLDDENYNR